MSIMFKKIIGFFTNKTVLYAILFLLLLIFSLLFYMYSPMIAFDDIHIFGNAFIRTGLIFLMWLFVFFYFLLKPTIELVQSFKSEKRQLTKSLKKEAIHIFKRAKRNYVISLDDAKNTWKKDLKFKNIPLVIIIGNEGAGKSSFINYSNIEYPLSDSLQSYKKIHKSTNNFGLYISKHGALLDTEGNYFSQESFFNPDSTDEIPEDDINKNKEFLLKKNVWNRFLSFLNTNVFHSKLNGVVLVIDVQSFLINPKEYSNDLIHYLVKRVSECEKNLGLKVPIYIVFSKIDLIEGMSEYWAIFNERVTNRILGLTLDSEPNKTELQSGFQEISKSLLYALMNKNQALHSLEDKNTAFLFLKQLDYLFALVIEFVLQAHTQNKLKNTSNIRGIYFTSAYQENVPRNYLIDAICEKYDVKKPPAKSATKRNKQSYFVQSLLEHIILRDSHLSGVIVRNIALKIGAIILTTCLLSYGLSAYFLTKANQEIAKGDMNLQNITTLLNQALSYKDMSLQQKANLMLSLKAILKNYPYLFDKGHTFIQYPLLEISYKGFLSAKDLYYMLNEDVISNTLIKEMEQILQTDNTPQTLIETLYMYMALFEEKYFHKALLGRWISTNWQHFAHYQIPKEDFIAGIEDLNPTSLAKAYAIDSNKLENIRKKIIQIPKQYRIYTLIAFHNSLKQQRLYNIKNKLGSAFDAIFENAEQLASISKDYTKEGLMEFLGNLESNTQRALDIDAWDLAQPLDSKELKTLQMDIITIYLTQYQQKWQDILSALVPKQHTTKSGVLSQLQILSHPQNPLNALMKILSDNTYLNDTLLLNYVYSLGLPSSDIKTKFATISNHFKPYYEFVGEESFLDSKLHSLSKQNNKESNTGTIQEILAMDIQNIHSKITNFTQDSTKDIKAKIAYILEGSNEENDPFKKFATDTKDLPSYLARYYDKLATFSWRILENTSGTLLNNAWKNEVYAIFINEISPFYPFNAYSQESLPIESFKSFFGNQGTLQTFYQQYLSKLLLKRGGAYYPNPEYKSKIAISQEFLAFLNRSITISAMFDNNNNLNLNFFVHCLDLSSDFSSLDISYNDKTLHYDHTLNQKIQIIVEQFNNSTELRFVANDYNQNPQYQKTYMGEWAWFGFLKDITKTQASQNTFYFEGNAQWYFDFTLSPNPQVLFTIVNLLSRFTLPQSII